LLDLAATTKILFLTCYIQSAVRKVAEENAFWVREGKISKRQFRAYKKVILHSTSGFSEHLAQNLGALAANAK
jgi:hypothetical protein